MATRADDIPVPLTGTPPADPVPSPDGDAPPETPPTLQRIAEMRAALERGEDPLAVGAAAQEAGTAAATEHDAAMHEATDEQTTDATLPPGTEPPPEQQPPEQQQEPETPPEPEPITVELPAVRDGQEPVELAVADEETAQRIRSLVNDRMRRDEYNKRLGQVQEQHNELNYIYQSMEADPAGFLLQEVGEDIRADVARHLLATLPDDAFAKLVEDLQTWQDDPRERRLNALELERAREERARTAREAQAQEAARARRAQSVVDAITALIPADMDEADADFFDRNARYEIQKYIQTHQLQEMDPALVPVILDKVGLLRRAGIARPVTPRAPATPPAAGARPAPAVPADDRAKAQAGAAQIAARVAAKQAGSAVAPPGAGAAPAAGSPLVPGEPLKDRIAKLRANPHLIRGR